MLKASGQDALCMLCYATHDYVHAVLYMLRYACCAVHVDLSIHA